MPMFGVHLYPTGYSMDPVQVVKAAEERGLDSVTYPEHTHIPTSRKTPFPGEGELPKSLPGSTLPRYTGVSCRRDTARRIVWPVSRSQMKK